MTPVWVALDGAGNLYYVDGGSSLVRQINTSRIVNTVAGALQISVWAMADPPRARSL